MASSAPLRVGIVGANPERGWAKDAHVPALRVLPDFSITAVSARTLETAQAAVEAFGATHALETTDLVRSPEVDVVAVTVKVPEHLPIVLAALEAGKHVFCEWPLGRDRAEAETLTEAAGKASGRAIIGLQGVAAPAVRQAAEVVRSGALGQLLSARIVSPTAGWGPIAPPFYAYLNDRRNGATLTTIPGGHTLSVVEYVLGSIVELQAQAVTQYPKVRLTDGSGHFERNCPDHIGILAQHETGCVSSIEIAGAQAVTTPFVFELKGEAGELQLSGSFPGGFQAGNQRLETTADVAPLEPAVQGLHGPPSNVAELYAMLEHEVRTGERRAPGFGDALRLTRLLDCVEHAAQTGSRQRFGGH